MLNHKLEVFDDPVISKTSLQPLKIGHTSHSYQRSCGIDLLADNQVNQQSFQPISVDHSGHVTGVHGRRKQCHVLACYMERHGGFHNSTHILIYV